MNDDIVARLRLYAQKQRETNSMVLGLLLSDSADEIERLRGERDELQKWKDAHNTFWRDRAERRDAMRDSVDGIDWKHRALCAEATLARYKRMYARASCRDLYSAGAKWKIRKNPMRSDGVFIEEDCEPLERRTFFPFPHQFEEDVAEEIVELLNRATEELEHQSKHTEPAALRGTPSDGEASASEGYLNTGESVQTEKADG